GGAGTTGQVLRAGVPHLVMPYAHDQFDNAARCRRAGVAEVIGRDEYAAEAAASLLEKILGTESYAAAARESADIVAEEGGSTAAAHAVERALDA
ncbi:MAG TPA: nucleotide disphospho-sugar-binding domain-containing protein, partial [Pyrinomonadaceae bacterium]|nr:nucleotide disphospho-sugar-binding domain-containing protein [Pyrinomonadaceae bacterium]